MPPNTATISRDQLKRLCEQVLGEAPEVLKGRDKNDPKMDRKGALLWALYSRVREKLGMPEARWKVETYFPTYEFSCRSALYEILLERQGAVPIPADHQRVPRQGVEEVYLP